MICLIEPRTIKNHKAKGEAMLNRSLSSAIAATMLSLLVVAPAQAQKARAKPSTSGIIDRTFFFQPGLVAIQNGFIRRRGPQRNMRFIRSGEGQAEGLMKGTSTRALLDRRHPAECRRGGPLRMLAANSGRLSHYIVTQKKFRKVEELKGATVGILTLTEAASSTGRRSLSTD